MNYYSHTCKCGCGGQIEIRESHKYDGIPLYITGHSSKGKHPTEETRAKLSLAKKGKKPTEVTRQKISNSLKELYSNPENHPMYGKHHTEEARQKVSKGNTGRKHTEEVRKKQSESHSGEKHYNWQNGISKLPYAFDFTDELKQYIKDRDFNICQEPNCMEVSDLVTHHIDYNKQNSSIDNLISLCRKHHSKTNGKKKREYFTNYYQEILNVYL